MSSLPVGPNFVQQKEKLFRVGLVGGLVQSTFSNRGKVVLRFNSAGKGMIISMNSYRVSNKTCPGSLKCHDSTVQIFENLYLGVQQNWGGGGPFPS